MQLQAHWQAILQDPLSELSGILTALGGGQEHRAEIGQAMLRQLLARPVVIRAVGDDDLDFIACLQVAQIAPQVALALAGGGALRSMMRATRGSMVLMSSAPEVSRQTS